MKKIIGYILLTIIILILFGATILKAGFANALMIWLIAIVLTGTVSFAFHLIYS